MTRMERKTTTTLMVLLGGITGYLGTAGESSSQTETDRRTGGRTLREQLREGTLDSKRGSSHLQKEKRTESLLHHLMPTADLPCDLNPLSSKGAQMPYPTCQPNHDWINLRKPTPAVSPSLLLPYSHHFQRYRRNANSVLAPIKITIRLPKHRVALRLANTALDRDPL